MSNDTPTQRVADVLAAAGYHQIKLPLHIAGLEFDVAAAFIGMDRTADLVIVGDMAAHGERKVIHQIEGIARALDVMRSRRPLTSVIIGPRPVGKTLETLAQVGRVLSVEEALDPVLLRDQLAVLLPLKLPDSLSEDRDLGSKDELTLPSEPFARELLEASKFDEAKVRDRFHAALNAVLSAFDEEDPNEEAGT